MVNSLVRSSFNLTNPSHPQGGIDGKLRSSTKIDGLKLRFPPVTTDLNYTTLRRRCSSNSSAFLPPRCPAKIEQPNSGRKGSATKPPCAKTSGHGDEIVQESDVFISTCTKFLRKWDAFLIFARPHTAYGLVLGILSTSLLPVQTMSELTPRFFVEILKTIAPTVLMNTYTNGINALCDIEIDKINKPYYPLASGELSVAAAIAITASSAILSLVMVVMLNSKPLLISITTTFLMYTAYSVDLPLLRWKNSALLTLASIICERAFLIPLCHFAHAQKYVLGRPLVYTKPVLFTVAFMTIFFGVISTLKDIPDVEGDKAFGVKSLSVIYGKENVFWSCVYTLLALYGGASVIVGATPGLMINKFVVVVGHAILAYILWNRAKNVDISERSSTTLFYLFIWKLLYGEYLLIPFVR